MPPAFLFDLGAIDLTKVAYDKEAVRQANPQRGDMEQLDGIIWADPDHGRILGYKDVRDDEFWVAGHIPGRPLFPGVLMIEASAQVASFYTRTFVGWKGFIGFGGADAIRFRQAVTPGCRMYILVQKMWHRHRRIECKVQGVVNGLMAYECTIIGTEF